MLKTDCPNCRFSLSSKILTEDSEIECAECKETFQVKDVYIYAWPYTIYREVALKNVDKYIRLLRETKADVALMEELGKDSMPYRESAKSLNQFADMLTELLDGCRSEPRVPCGDTTVEYYIGDAVYTGNIRNISSTGICISISGKSNRIGPGRIIKMNINDNALSETLCLKGWVIWSTEKGITGLKFVGLEETSRAALQDFIEVKNSMVKAEAGTPVDAAAGA